MERLPLRGIDHVAINVRDLARALDFYTGLLGLPVTQREPSKPGIEYFLDCGESLVGLIQARNDAPEHLLQEGGAGGNHLSFRVPAREFDAVLTALETAGVPIRFAKRRARSWSLYFSDPDGNKLEITAWPIEDGLHPGTWRNEIYDPAARTWKPGP